MTPKNTIPTEKKPQSGYVYKKTDTTTDQYGNETQTITYAKSLYGVAITPDWREVPQSEYENWKTEQQPTDQDTGTPVIESTNQQIEEG